MKRVVTSLPFLATAFLALIVLAIAFQRSRDSQHLLGAFPDAPGVSELVVHMPFEPEAFHIAKLQSAGRIVGIEGMSVHIRAVKYDQLRMLSWQPWITELEPLAQNQP